VTANPLDSIRAILVSPEQQRLRALELELESLQRQSEARLLALQAELDAARQAGDIAEERLIALQAEAAELRRLFEDTAGLLTRLRPALSGLLRQSIRDSRDDMAEALSPVMGAAIRAQIRDSRPEMIEALYPIIGETVQRAIAEFGRELQRNIDARLKTTFGPEGALRAFWARVRGVSPAELALRDALPFEVRELFLIQRGSGLLLAHHSAGAAATDSDLISGMLTAIRDFVSDSFARRGEEAELDEVQYGDEHIIIEGGSAVYLAAVLEGVEPQGFRAALRDFVSELHVRYEPALRGYQGDPATLPNLPPQLARLAQALRPERAAAPRPMPRLQRLALAGGAFAGVGCLALACFYSVFTYNLLPVAFPPALTQTATLPSTETRAASATPTAAPSLTATTTPTATAAPSATATTATTATGAPTATVPPSTVAAFARGNVWAREGPAFTTTRLQVIEQGTPLVVRAAFGDWLDVEWQTERGPQRGWASAEWVTFTTPLPASVITPVP
jgi:uncharacterized protein YraI